MNEQTFELLQKINVESRDDGEKFTVFNRINAIQEAVSGTGYLSLAEEPLFYLYGKKPFSQLPENLIVISSHIDCVPQITRFSTERLEAHLIHGTFDNSLTNTAAVLLMQKGILPENVLFAFTGDEEDDSCGANQLTTYLRKADKQFFAIVLDVTDMGWEENRFFTVENNFWAEDRITKSIMDGANRASDNWGFVASDPDDIPCRIPFSRVVRDRDGTPEEAQCDESWEYDERDIPCFSLCIPVEGHMHSNLGVTARTEAFRVYVEALAAIARELSLMF